MQLWPELLYPVRAQTAAAAAMSASSQTMVAALPPSSRTRRLAPGGPGHGGAGGGAAGEADHADLGRRAQRRADLAAAVQQLHGLGGRRLEQQRDDGRGDGRGLRRRLDDRGVAGGERRAELVREQVGRGVERGDGQRHAGRRPVGQRGVADAARPAGHRQHVAADLAGLGRAHGEGVGDPVDLAAAVLDRLAELQGDQPGESSRRSAASAAARSRIAARAAGASRATACAACRGVAGGAVDVGRAGLRGRG